MPTEQGREAARQTAWGEMTKQHMTIARLAETAKVDPATVGDFLNGKRWPRASTIAKLEQALELTRGTLAAIGEERPGVFRLDASRLDGSDALTQSGDGDLVAELGYRLEDYRRRLKVTQDELAEARARLEEVERASSVRPLHPVQGSEQEQMVARKVATSKDRINDDEEPS